MFKFILKVFAVAAAVAAALAAATSQQSTPSIWQFLLCLVPVA